MLRAIIVDDELRSRETLQELIKESCEDVEVLETVDGIESAVEAIKRLRPDLLFLDIELQSGTGFDLLEKVKNFDIEVIFTTAFENYALRALKISAVDFLLKPVNEDELVEAVQKVVNKRKIKSTERNFDLLLQNLNAGISNHKIALPTAEGLTFIQVSDIIRCQADGSYTHFFFKDAKKILVSKKIKEYEELLSPYNFVRVHHSHLINLNEVTKYVRGDGGYVVLSDGETVYVSKRKKDDFMQALNKA